MRKKMEYVLIGLGMSLGVHAQDSLQTKTLNEVVVTGTKFSIPVEKSGKSITRISANQLQNQGNQLLAYALNQIPNVQIDGVYGTPGTNLGYYVRGARNRQTIILVDGVPMLDPSGISPEFDLRLLPVSQISNVEVMRGGLSTLYGSGAAAGVINITLKKPEERSFNGSLDLNGGSFNTFSQNLSIGGRVDKLYYQVLGNNSTSKGFSSAADNVGSQDFDKDGFSRQNVLAKLGVLLTDDIDIQIFGGADQFTAEYDGGPFADANNEQTYAQWRVGLKSTIGHRYGSLQLTAQHLKLDKEFKSSFPSAYSGTSTFIEAFDKIDLSKMISVLGGVSYQRLAYNQAEQISSDSTFFTIVDPYLSVVLDAPFGLQVQAGARLNNHSAYGSNITYNVNPSYLLKINEGIRLKLFASVATSFITPSLFQLYGNYGNKNLKPEEALNKEAGISFYTDRLSISAVYFRRAETNAYGFRSLFDDEGNFAGGEYFNVETERNVKGAELEIDYRLSSRISTTLNYGYVTADNPTSFYRIPNHKINIALQSGLWKGGNASLRYQYTGSRQEMDFSVFEEVDLPAFHLVDLSISQQVLSNKLDVYGSVNNIFNTNYVWAFGYNSMPRNIQIGVRFTF